jgi:5'(3')-deoxyribonucleotidase
MEWTEGSGIEFIEIYKRKEIIWDPKHPKHFNRIRKQDAWEELRKEINRTVECKKKMDNLLSSLRREK